MTDLKNFEVWFVTGSQHLYGEETLNKVAEHSQIIAKSFNDDSRIPVTVIWKPIQPGIALASSPGCILFLRQKCG